MARDDDARRSTDRMTNEPMIIPAALLILLNKEALAVGDDAPR